MAGVGEVASITQLIVLTISTAQEVCSIYHSWKSSPRELESISNEVATFSQVLNALRLRVGNLERSLGKGHRPSLDADMSNDTSQSTLRLQFITLLDSSHDVVLKVQRLLSQSPVRKPKRVFKIFKAIAWHLKFPILQKALFELERHKSSLQLFIDSING